MSGARGVIFIFLLFVFWVYRSLMFECIQLHVRESGIDPVSITPSWAQEISHDKGTERNGLKQPKTVA